MQEFYMTKRIIKDVSSTGKISREKIRAVVSAVHVAPEKDRWQVKKTGKNRISESFSSRESAIEYGKNISQKSGVNLIVHSATENGYNFSLTKNPKLNKLTVDE